jgi:hypothetical protein
VSETLREVILAFDGTIAIMIFSPAMVAIAIWHEIRERRRQRLRSSETTSRSNRDRYH